MITKRRTSNAHLSRLAIGALTIALLGWTAAPSIASEHFRHHSSDTTCRTVKRSSRRKHRHTGACPVKVTRHTRNATKHKVAGGASASTPARGSTPVTEPTKTTTTKPNPLGSTTTAATTTGPVTTGTTTTGTTTTGTTTTGTTTTTSTPTLPASGDPLAGDRLYVSPSNPAAAEQSTLESQGETTEADEIGQIASQQSATWLVNDNSVNWLGGFVATAAAAGKVPVLVVYNIPWRDCGLYSSGGASSPEDYENFVDGAVNDIGQAKVVVIVEPDALSELTCLPDADQQSYLQLLHYATQQFSSDPNAAVYVDAGNPEWQTASVEAQRLQQVVTGTNAGFSVNVDDFIATSTDIAYATAISALVGGRHFVVDTSRNGGDVSPSEGTCNPAGAKLGATPTTNTGNELVDAYLWIKPPGTSDGTCNGGPGAGQFFLSYALGLLGD
jgi:endoglucanase